MSVTLSAQIFTVLTGVVIIFQACLAAGMPWGAASMGGKYPGKYPPKMRIVALVNIVVFMFLAIIVLSKAGLLFSQWLPFSKRAIWFVVVLLLLGSVMNSITPSKIERIWAPVVFTQFITSLIVALH